MAETKAQRVRRAVAHIRERDLMHQYDALSEADWLIGREYRPIDVWIECSPDSPGHWDALRRVASALLREDPNSMPPGLCDWVADVLDGNRPRPPRPGPDSVGFHWNVARVVFLTCFSFDLKPTRRVNFGGECCDDGGSGCDVAGIVFGPESKPLQYSTVATIWQRSEERKAWQRLKRKVR